MSVKVVVVIRPNETREVVGEADTFEQARDAAIAQVPDGYDVLSIRQVRD